MVDKIAFELVSPDRLLKSGDVAMVVVPGGDGDFGAMKGHAPFISTVRPGVIRIFDDSITTETDRIFVAGGFAEVTGARVTVLAELALPVSEIDKTKADQEVKNAEEDLADAKDPAEKTRLEALVKVLKEKAAAAA